jgi:RAB protein geranylgeranyltransferase component A
MQFFKMVTDYTESSDGTVAELAASNLDQPFVEILQRQNLPSHLQEIILYAIALADEDQELVTDTRRLLTAKEGFANLALYLASVSRYLCVLIPFSCVHYMRMVDCCSLKGYISFSTLSRLLVDLNAV